MATWEIESPQRIALDGEVGELSVWLAHGKLRVVGTDGPTRLEVTSVGAKGITVSLEDGTLSVRHRFNPSWWHKIGPFWWFLSGRHRYHASITIAVPPTCTADLTLISGNVVASGLRRGGSVDVTSGSITLMGLGGRVRAKTVSGSIQAMGVAGDLRLETVSGEITLAESSADRVTARTISGSVTCDLDNPFAREVRLDTTSGGITVRVPEDADLQVSLNATSGRVISAFPQVRVTGMPGLRSASGRLGTGSGTLNAYAVSGSVSLLARPAADRDDASADAPAPGPVDGAADPDGPSL
jgi:DUF4097 and DUF4098 domain-containing protein YvlB